MSVVHYTLIQRCTCACNLCDVARLWGRARDPRQGVRNVSPARGLFVCLFVWLFVVVCACWRVLARCYDRGCVVVVPQHAPLMYIRIARNYTKIASRLPRNWYECTPRKRCCTTRCTSRCTSRCTNMYIKQYIKGYYGTSEGASSSTSQINDVHQ